MERIMNGSLVSVDRLKHLKWVVIALSGITLLIWIGITTRLAGA
jgi:hypothetical protein